MTSPLPTARRFHFHAFPAVSFHMKSFHRPRQSRTLTALLLAASLLGPAPLGAQPAPSRAPANAPGSAQGSAQAGDQVSDRAEPTAQGPSQRVTLAVGAQREIRIGRQLERIAIGNPDVADALLLKSRGASTAVLLVARKPGNTDLMVWPSGEAPIRYAVQVDAMASDGQGAQIDVAGQGAIIRGQSADAAAAAGAQQAARATVGNGPVIDRSTVPVSGTVQVDVRVVEISKNVLKQAGFNFYRNRSGFAFGSFSPSTLTRATFTPRPGGSNTGGGLATESTAPISSAFNLVAASMSHGIFANLSLLEGNGMARILAEPSLVALSGQSASFLAGGEIPIPVAQALGTTTIHYKQFGIGLTVTPTVLSPDRIALKVAPEASDLDPSRGIVMNGATIPAIVTRRADTTVELGDGESFVIGGLVSRNTVSNIDKVPVLGDLPLIGAFFKNLNFHQEDRELVIIVTPHLVRPLAKGSSAAARVGADGRTSANPPVWGKFLGGELVDPALPGFSR